MVVIVLCNKGRGIGARENKFTAYKKKNLPSVLEAAKLQLVLRISNRPVASPRFS